MEEEVKHVFTWTIENFRACTHKNRDFLSSPAFMAESLFKTTWRVDLYPKGTAGTETKFISCFLKRLNGCSGPEEIEIDYIVEAIGGSNKHLQLLQYVRKYKKGQSFGWSEFLNRELLSDTNKCVPLGSLTIRVTLINRVPHISTQNSCLTNIATDHFSFHWNLKHSVFSSAEIKPVSLSENLKLEITIEIPKDDVEISIRRINGFIGSQKMICKVTLLDLKGKDTTFEEAVFEADFPDEKDTWKFPTFLKKNAIYSDKDPNSYFTLKFDFFISDGKQLDSFQDIESHIFSLKDKEDVSGLLKTDLKQAWINNVHTDVELHADDKVFRAHKFILCARSPVFSTMFNQDMVENQTQKINIPDVEAGTLKSLLEFMYTGDTEIIDFESALKLLLASDKYQVLHLKKKCSSSLEPLLSDENVSDILYTADLVQQESLKVCAVNHIKQNHKKILKSDEWKMLAEKNLKLATQTVCEVSNFLTM